MIVYGDSQFLVCSRDLISSALKKAESISKNSLDDLRSFLIFAGQLEQAFADDAKQSREGSSVLQNIQNLTDWAARAFCAHFAESNGLQLYFPFTGQTSISNCQSEFQRLREVTKSSLRLKIPEGFAFYALFPEQYFLSTVRWSADHATLPRKDVLVVGIRSIGTTLSAVVAACLEAGGWNVKRITVRPHGHPFNRQVALDQNLLKAASTALVVDEGPGLSGSSMAAVASALVNCGTPHDRIFFFPAHNHAPGKHSSEIVQECWRCIKRYTTGLGEVRWNKEDISEQLARKTAEILKTGERICVEDLSGGEWRKLVYGTEAEWPSVAPQWERMKFLCRMKQTGTGILWKFVGSSFSPVFHGTMAESLQSEMDRPTLRSLVPKPLAIFAGFVAMPWIEGRRLIHEDAQNPSVLEHIAGYIAAAKKTPLSPSEARKSFLRIRKVIFENACDLLSSDVRGLVREAAVISNCASYGDGRMAPYEWVQTVAGEITKTDCTGHDADHTIVGQQPIHWDIAGALVEWRMDANVTRDFLRLMRNQIDFTLDQIQFYQLAYVAFRLGVCSMALSNVDSVERKRIEISIDFYQHYLHSFHLQTREFKLLVDTEV